GGRRKPTIGKKLLFARALLRSVKRRATRAHWRQRFDRFNGIDWDVLELECHDIDMPCERPKRVEILVIGDDLDIGYLAGWRIFLWRERMDAVSHPMRRNGKHPSELSAAEHAERRARTDHPRHGNRSCLTLCVCSFRN